MRTPICPACQQLVATRDSFCVSCGARLPRRRRWLLVTLVSVLAVTLFAAAIGLWLWYAESDRQRTVHGISFNEAGWNPEDMSPHEVRASGSDWALELAPYVNGGSGVIRIYGTRYPSHKAASDYVGNYAGEMTRFAEADHGTIIDGPRLVRLPASGAAMRVTWDDREGGGRYYAMAVGSQLVLVVCLGSATGSNDKVDAACTRITETIKPSG